MELLERDIEDLSSEEIEIEDTQIIPTHNELIEENSLNNESTNSHINYEDLDQTSFSIWNFRKGGGLKRFKSGTLQRWICNHNNKTRRCEVVVYEEESEDGKVIEIIK